jgi:hypothetical protein
MGEIAGKLFATVLLIIPFETPVSADVKQYRNSHYLPEGQAAPGKPRPTGVGRQQMGCATALKPGTKVIDITRNPGYTVVIHKTPSRFLYNEVLGSAYK